MEVVPRLRRGLSIASLTDRDGASYAEDEREDGNVAVEDVMEHVTSAFDTALEGIAVEVGETFRKHLSWHRK